MSRRSVASMSGVLKRVSSVLAETTRPARVRIAAAPVPVSCTQCSDATNRSAHSTMLAIGAPFGSRSQMPWMISRRPNIDRFRVNPSGPARRSKHRAEMNQPDVAGVVDAGVDLIADQLHVKTEVDGALLNRR